MKIIVGKHAKNIAAGILSLYFLLVASYLIDSPGIYYDEITFVNISLGGIHDHFVHKRIFGIPVMMMPYIGALKSYIFSPVFQIFGVSAASIRIPAILISCCTIYIGFLLCKQVLMPDNGMYPILFAAVLATDPAFIINSRLDYGPVVLMTFLKLLSLYFFYKLIRTRSLFFLWAMFIVLLLGLYDKLNFIWHIVAFGVAAILVYHNDLLIVYRNNRGGLIVPTAGFLIVIGMVVAGMIIPLTGLDVGVPDRTVFEKVQFMKTLYLGTMNGRCFFEFIFDVPIRTTTVVNYFVIPTLMGILILLFCYFREKSKSMEIVFQTKAVLFLLIIILLILFQVILTKQVGGQHHVMMLYPFHHILVIFTIVALSGLHDRRKRFPVRAVSTIALIILIASQVNTTREYVSGFREKSNLSILWNYRIYELANYLNYVDADVIISADWGIHNQVFSLADKSRRHIYYDLWPIFNVAYGEGFDEEQNDWLYNGFFKGKKAYILVHAEGNLVMKNVRMNLFSFAEKFGLKLEMARIFYGRDDQVLYEVYYASP